MRKRRKVHGYIRQILAFEAAARHASFTKSAKELGVTQPAVSFAIKQLESQLEVSLFRRNHRRISLTARGRELYLEARDAFDSLERCVARLNKQGLGQHVTLSCSTAFANHWFVPRLGEFQKEHPDIDLRLQTTDRDLDLKDENADLSVRRGRGLWPGYSAANLAPDVLFPVAAPTFDLSEDWSSRRLIHLEEPNRPRPGWADFFKAMNMSQRPNVSGLRLNDYALVIQAAMAGEGVALGWSHIVDAPIARGMLVRVGTLEWHTGLSHDLIWSRAASERPQVSAVRAWILGASS